MDGDAIETGATEVRELEIAHLELKYAHTRILKRELLVSLAASIEEWGQILPVVTVSPCVLVGWLPEGGGLEAVQAGYGAGRALELRRGGGRLQGAALGL